MANNAMPIERLQALDNIEKEIAGCIQSAGIQNSHVIFIILVIHKLTDSQIFKSSIY